MSVDLSPRTDTITQRKTVQLLAAARDKYGYVIRGASIAWRSSDPAVATVDAAGVVTATKPGSVRVTAAVADLSAAADLTVLPPLALTSTDTLLVPATTFTIRGTGFTSARFAFNAQPISVQLTGDSIARFTPQAALFEPCVPPATNWLLTIDNGAKDHAEAHVSITALPMNVQLGPGDYRIANGSAVDCEIHVSGTGQYLAVPFVRERPTGRKLDYSDSVRVRLIIGAGATAARAMLRVGATHISRSIHREIPPVGRTIVPDLMTFPTRISRSTYADTACTLPTQLGDTVMVQTSRNPLGKLFGPGGYQGYGPTTTADEPWSVAAISNHSIVFTDTQTLREMAADAKLRAKIQGLATVYDSIVLPFYTKWTRGVPDKDGTGKLVLYVGDAGQIPNWANVVGTSMRRCTGPGESVFLNAADAILPLGVFIHEVGHVADLGWGPLHYEDGIYEEGTATFFATLYQQGNSDSALFANAPTFGTIDGNTTFCVLPSWQIMSGFFNVSRGYVFGCFELSYLLQRRMQTVGGSLRDALLAWGARPDSVLTITRAAAALGIPSVETVFPEFLASWYADDFVSGTRAALQSTMWNVRQIMQTPGISSQYSFIMPDLTWSIAGGDVTFPLGAPDGRFVQFDAGATTTMILSRTPATFDANLTGVLILRTR